MDFAAPIERLLALLQSVWLSFAARFGINAVLDIAIVALLLYWLLSLISGTSAATLVRGILILLTLGFVLSNVFNLTMLQFLLRNSIPALIFAIPVLFQPEIRRALEQLGRAGSLIPRTTVASPNTRLAETAAGPARDDVATRLAFGYYGRGLAYAMLNDNRDALPDFRAAVRGAPDEPEMANGLCWTLAVLGESMDEARQACDTALRLRPDYAEALDSRALVNLRQGRFQEAWRDYDAALRLSPDATNLRYGRGIAALRLGRTAEGNADIAGALAASPGLAATYAGYGIRP